MLLLNKYYIDELYELLLIKPYKYVANLLWQIGDVMIIDGLGPNGAAKISEKLSGVISRGQSGYLYNYALVMVIGLVGLITWYIVRA